VTSLVRPIVVYQAFDHQDFILYTFTDHYRFISHLDIAGQIAGGIYFVLSITDLLLRCHFKGPQDVINPNSLPSQLDSYRA